MGESRQRQKPSAHGRTLGSELARLAAGQRASYPEIPEMCSTCAFREGTLPNQMAGTLVQALHCVLGSDPAPFMCHHAPGVVSGRNQPTELCAGYLLAGGAPFEDVRAALERAHGALGGNPVEAKPDV